MLDDTKEDLTWSSLSWMLPSVFRATTLSSSCQQIQLSLSSKEDQSAGLFVERNGSLKKPYDHDPFRPNQKPYRLSQNLYRSKLKPYTIWGILNVGIMIVGILNVVILKPSKSNLRNWRRFVSSSSWEFPAAPSAAAAPLTAHHQMLPENFQRLFRF